MTLLRVYDRNDKYALTGECYFAVLPKNYDDEELERRLTQIAGMSWQNYTSYALGECDDLKEDELFWCEVCRYEIHEVKIEVNRVKNIKKYRLPEWMTYREEF